MKPIYIIEVFDCGHWFGFYAGGYFTSEKKASLFLNNMLSSLEPSKKDLYQIRKIYKNEKQQRGTK